MHSIQKYITAAAFCLSLSAPLLVLPELAEAQTVELQASGSDIYVDMPFQLSVIATDFDEKPQPEVQPFEIEDADVQFIAASPRISSMTTIINGKRTSKRDVTYVFTYQITPKREGVFTIPPVVVQQDGKSASTANSVRFTASTVPMTNDMKLELQIPDRKFWVGETFEATLAWYLRKSVGNQNFNIPILRMPDTFDVSEPDDVPRGGIPLQVGSRTIAFPYSKDDVMVNGIEYTRFSIPIRLTPLKSGVISIPASSVQAELVTGQSHDFFGFGQSSYSLFRATDIARTCTVRELPQASKPATFSNAMGSDYAIEVKADRTIVKAGDSILLTIDISSPSSLDGLILPSLIKAGLNEQLFTVSTEDPVGENIKAAQNRNIKRFNVPVRVQSERVTEIPPLAFSYFNPKTEEFSTVRSQPIALSVTAVNKISASDVFTTKRDTASQPQAQAPGEAPAAIPVLSNQAAAALELSLNTTEEDLSDAPTHTYNRPIRVACYILPALLWAGLAMSRRIRKKQSANAPQKEAAIALKKALDGASEMSARDASPAITNALSAFCQATETSQKPFDDLNEALSDLAYRPSTADKPVNKALIDKFRETIKQHVNPAFAKLISSLFALLLVIGIALAPQSAQAQSASDTATLSQASEAYHRAMETEDRAERLNQFKRAYALFNTLSEKHPDNPALLVDSGHAALGATDFGHAALAYSRALKIDPTREDAQKNLAYIKSFQNEPVRAGSELFSSSFFLNSFFSKDTRLLLAALCFAVGFLLIIPWSRKHRRWLCYLSTIPFILWIWLLSGTLLEPQSDAAIVMSESYLKTADNTGAANVSPAPLEPGFTVEILKTSNGWHQVRTANQDKGWLQASAVERISRNP
ncbi:MAG: BatD family protein [Proteobacteria bacterium]|nr:BatD family protein [Pseudomonadota bacterium]